MNTRIFNATMLMLLSSVVLTSASWLPQSIGQEKKMSDIRVQPFAPSEDVIYKATNQQRLADWDYYDNYPLDITSIEFVGFQRYNHDKPMHFTIKEHKYIRMFQDGLATTYMLRPGVSDLTLNKIAYGCDTDFNNAIIINTPQKQVVLGVSCLGFQLDDLSPNKRTVFYSWILTKAVDDILFDKTGFHLEKDIFDNHSGLAVIGEQKKAYEAIVRDSSKNE